MSVSQLDSQSVSQTVSQFTFGILLVPDGHHDVVEEPHAGDAEGVEEALVGKVAVVQP